MDIDITDYYLCIIINKISPRWMFSSSSAVFHKDNRMSSEEQAATTRGRSASLFVHCDGDVKADGQDVRLHPSANVCALWLTEFQLRMSFLKVSPSSCRLSEVITSHDPPPPHAWRQRNQSGGILATCLPRSQWLLGWNPCIAAQDKQRWTESRCMNLDYLLHTLQQKT